MTVFWCSNCKFRHSGECDIKDSLLVGSIWRIECMDKTGKWNLESGRTITIIKIDGDYIVYQGSWNGQYRQHKDAWNHEGVPYLYGDGSDGTQRARFVK